MAGPISNYVSLTINRDSIGIARREFGVALYLSANASFPERVRTYTGLADVAVDFPSTTGPEYLFAQQVFSQSPHPDQIMIGRSALKPTQVYTVSCASVQNSHTYVINAAGDGVTSTAATYAADSATTAAEVHNGMVTALNAVVGKNYTAAFAALVYADKVFTAANATEIFTAASHGLQTGDGPFQVSNSGGALPTGLVALTDYWVIRIDANTFYLATSLANALAGTNLLISTDGTGTQTLADVASTKRPSDPFLVTGDAAGEWFSLEVSSVTDWTIAQTHADPGVATDLAAILLENQGWYVLVTGYNSNAYVLAAAAYIEANNRLYLADCSDSASVTAVVTSSDTLDDLHTLSRERTGGWYHPAPAAMLAASVAGACLAQRAGSVTFALQPLTGVAAVNMTGTQRANLVAKKANSYELVSDTGINVTFNGTVASGEFIDVIRDLDWVTDDVTKAFFGVIIGPKKVPFTDRGGVRINNALKGSMKRTVERTIASDDPKPETFVPKVADVDPADKAARRWSGIKFNFTLASAVHSGAIVGTVSS